MYTDRKAKILRDHQKQRRFGNQRISKITLNMERRTFEDDRIFFFNPYFSSGLCECAYLAFSLCVLLFVFSIFIFLYFLYFILL